MHSVQSMAEVWHGTGLLLCAGANRSYPRRPLPTCCCGLQAGGGLGQRCPQLCFPLDSR